MYKKQVVFKVHFKPFICQFCPFAEQFGRIAWHRSLAVQIWRILGGWKLTQLCLCIFHMYTQELRRSFTWKKLKAAKSELVRCVGEAWLLLGLCRVRRHEDTLPATERCPVELQTKVRKDFKTTFSLLKAYSSIFTFKNVLRHYH